MRLFCRIGTGQRGILMGFQKNPGPGSYEQKPKLGEGPKYGMRPKTAVIQRNGPPGPGQYNPLHVPTKNRPPSAVIGKQSREGELGSGKGQPGPGAYLYAHKILPGPAYTFGTSRTMHKFTNVPGPGTYRVPCTFADVPTYLLPNKSEFSVI